MWNVFDSLLAFCPSVNGVIKTLRTRFVNVESVREACLPLLNYLNLRYQNRLLGLADMFRSKYLGAILSSILRPPPSFIFHLRLLHELSATEAFSRFLPPHFLSFFHSLSFPFLATYFPGTPGFESDRQRLTMASILPIHELTQRLELIQKIENRFVGLQDSEHRVLLYYYGKTIPAPAPAADAKSAKQEPSTNQESERKTPSWFTPQLTHPGTPASRIGRTLSIYMARNSHRRAPRRLSRLRGLSNVRILFPTGLGQLGIS